MAGSKPAIDPNKINKLLIQFAATDPSNTPESPPLPPELPLGWVPSEDQSRRYGRRRAPGFQFALGACRINNLFISLEGKIPSGPTDAPELPPKLPLDLEPVKEGANGTRSLIAGPEGVPQESRLEAGSNRHVSELRSAPRPKAVKAVFALVHELRRMALAQLGGFWAANAC